MRVLANIFENANLNAYVYKSSLDGVVPLVVSVPGVQGIAGAGIINNLWKELVIRLNFEECLFN